MIKKCKITNIINAPIRGVVDKPIREGNVVDLNCGQILVCLGMSTVDEILPSGATVRLNRDNYKLDNSGDTANLTIKDSIRKEDTVKIAPVKEEAKVEEVKEESKVEETPVTEPTKEKTEEVKEEAPVENIQNQQQNTKNNNKKNYNKK